MITIGLIQFPGSNCERETRLAIERAGMQAVDFLWNESLDKLTNCQGYVLIGGFSYEDRSRAGIIAALDPVMAEIKKQSETGKPVLGICNGAQILIEAGMVPRLDNQQELVALTDNKRLINERIVGVGFYNAWVAMRLSEGHQPNAFTRFLTPNDVIHLPVANAEGRFVMPLSLLNTLEKEGLNLFQYCDNEGNIMNEFPVNPNGSMGNIAAISNKAGNVLAMMPHPERTPNGDPVFASMRDYIANKPAQIRHYPAPVKAFRQPKAFFPEGNFQCVIQLLITDNHALTVQKTLNTLGFPVKVKRFIHWEIACEASVFEAIKKSGLLYSERKEQEVPLNGCLSEQTLAYLVRPKEDLIGQKIKHSLRHQWAIEVKEIRQGILWQFSCEDMPVHELIDNILLTNIIGNEYAHECYQFNNQLFR